MPTPRPIIAARVGAKVATSMKRASKVTRVTPRATPRPATTIGRPAATTEPKATSKMISAAMMPMSSLLGGSWPAKSSTWPLAPTRSESVFAALTSAMISFAAAVGIADGSVLEKVTVAIATRPSGLMPCGVMLAFSAACCSGVSLAISASGIGCGAGGQEAPRPWPVGRATHATADRSAIFCKVGVISASTAGSTALPVVGDHTMVAPASYEPVLAPEDASRSVAVFDSVLGRSKESFSEPAKAPPTPNTATTAMNQAMRAKTGRRTAQLDNPGIGNSASVR